MQTNVRLSDAEIEWLDSQGRSRSEAIRYAIRVAMEVDETVKALETEVIRRKALELTGHEEH